MALHSPLTLQLRSLGLAIVPAFTAPVAATEFGSAINMSEPGDNVISPQVAIDAYGKALVVWHSIGGGLEVIKARTRSAAGALGPIITLSGQAPGASWRCGGIAGCAPRLQICSRKRWLV